MCIFDDLPFLNGSGKIRYKRDTALLLCKLNPSNVLFFFNLKIMLSKRFLYFNK